MLQIYSAIKEVARGNSKSIYRIERDLGMSNGTIGKWNKSMPKADALQAVADYLGTTPQYLMRVAQKGKVDGPSTN